MYLENKYQLWDSVHSKLDSLAFYPLQIFLSESSNSVFCLLMFHLFTLRFDLYCRKCMHGKISLCKKYYCWTVDMLYFFNSTIYILYHSATCRKGLYITLEASLMIIEMQVWNFNILWDLFIPNRIVTSSNISPTTVPQTTVPYYLKLTALAVTISNFILAL